MSGELCIKFIIVRPLKCERVVPFWEKLMRKYRRERYQQKMLEKLPYKETVVTVMGRQGVEVELPFTGAELREMEKSYIENYIQRILDVYDISGCYLGRELSMLKHKFNMEKKWILNYLLFEEGLQLFLKENKIVTGNAKFVIIDSGDKKIQSIMETILNYANYLTIVTCRLEYFKKIVDAVYEETGLLINLESYDVKHKIYGNVIVNLDKEDYRVYSMLEENSYVMDLQFTDSKLNYLTSRRKDLTILYDYSILADDEELDKELIAEILLRDNWKISRFSKRVDTALSAAEMNSIVNYYQLKISKLEVYPNIDIFLSE